MKGTDSNRRRHTRFGFSGPLHWHSDTATGQGQVVDLSPGGAGFMVPQGDAIRLCGPLTIDLELGCDLQCRLARNARVRQIVPHDVDNCRVCVAFDDAPAN